jgi:glycosyltransferase involved in cell wall biosynthesis
VTARGRVTVVVTTRNSAKHLKAVLRSVREQTYPDVELIVVDNGSTDETVAVAERYADRVLDAGPERSAQRNRGVEASTGEQILILDSDMVLEPNVIAACMEALHRTNAAAVVVPEDTLGEGFWAACRALERSCYEGDESIEAARFFSSEAFHRHGGYDERLTGPEDWDLPARMRRAGEQITCATTRIHHIEGQVRLGPHLRKKYYYGKTFGPYIRRNPGLAARQFTVVRPAFIRHWRRLAARPTLAAGIVFLKVAELAWGAMGLLSTLKMSRDRR